MFVILEGIDGSGKSTLSKELQQHGAIFLSGENQHDITSIDSFLETAERLSNSNAVYICDRSFLSDLVYRYFDDKPCAAYTLEHLYKFCRYCNVLVYCKTNNAYENAMARGEDNITDRSLSAKLCEYYDFLIDICVRYNIMHVLKYDYAHMNVHDVINFIKEVQ